MVQENVSEIKCTDCGKSTTVPFKPRAGRPVYCKGCYSKHRSNRPSPYTTSPASVSIGAWARRKDDWKGEKQEKRASPFHTF